MSKHIYYNPESPKGREIESRYQARLDRLDEEATLRHASSEKKWGIDNTATKRTMVMSPFNGVLMSAEFFKEHRMSPNRHTHPMRDGLAISDVGYPAPEQSHEHGREPLTIKTNTAQELGNLALV
jgi:hypothetical protein